MALYQKSVLNKHLKQLEQPKVSKAYKKYVKYFLNPTIQDNIRNSKEEEYQGIFLTELFVNVLDYTLKPNVDFNLVAEYKNQSNARKADGAILSNNVAIGVIELKGTKTKDLESIRQQAFDYKANQKECVYVITSNYEKLRFYINDATEYEEFNLFELTEERFELLYLCLHKDNILNNIPLKTKEASIVVEEQITKQFYKDYSIFKRELFRDLVKRNAKRLKSTLSSTDVEIDEDSKADQSSLDKNLKLALFKKSQKLIDRFLFVFFAEDRGLLPPNSTIQILNKWKSDVDFGDERPLYDMFKQYFKFLDTGRQGTTNRAEIYAYNGGLFKEDSLLDKLEIDNDLLFKHTQILASYDFESQVDVNILGHIFENSLNEIESVNAEIEGGDFDKQKSKRKKDGVFYTPKYITKYIVENTIGKLCEEKKTELGFKEDEFFKGRKNRNKTTIERLVEQLDTYRNWLLQLTICDPACGSGAFLNQALDFLIKEHNYVDELKAKILGGGIVFSDIENTILENNIYGVDLNEESVEIAKLSLWLRTAQPRRKLNNLSSNIKCGNSLIESKTIAGDKAFKWQNEFPKIFEKGGFDVVIGNPPYGVIHEKQHKDYYKLKFESFQGNLENYCFFTEQFIKLTKDDNGKTGFIVPVTWLTIPQFENLRKLVLKYSIENFVELPTKIFSDADLDTLICILAKNNSVNNNVTSVSKVEIANNSAFEYAIYNPLKIEQKFWINDESLKIDLDFNLNKNDLLDTIRKNTKKLKDLFSVSQGIVPYAREELYKSMEKSIADNIVDSRLWHSDKQEDQFFKPELKGEDVTRYRVKWNEKQWVKYGNWLARPRTSEYFNSERILLREITRGSRFNGGFTKEESYNNPGLINIISKDKENKEKILKTLLPIINSKLLFFYHLSTSPKAKLKTSIPKILIKDVENLPIPSKEKLIDCTLSTLCDRITNLTTDFIDATNKFQKYLHSQFTIEKITKKLENWYELSFGDFIKEINKGIKETNKERIKNQLQPIKELTKLDEMNWMDVFETKKAEAQALKQQIDSTDSEIDVMVYELYGLSEEEIAIVENS
jgi:type I restriction-modification system DNA methylase subunit